MGVSPFSKEQSQDAEDNGDRAAYGILLKRGRQDQKELTGIGRIVFYNVKIFVPEREGTFIGTTPQTFLGIYEGEIYCGQP